MALLVNYHNSSTIELSTFDDTKNILTIEFKNGTSYEYYDVSIDMYESLVSASSTGKFFLNHIKDSYAFSQI